MSNTPPVKDPKADVPGAPASPATPIEPPLDEQLHEIWEKNHQLIIGAIIAVALVIIGRGVWDWYSARRQADIQTAFTAAATPEKLRGFIRDNAGHPLAGAAYLKLADDAYAAGKYADAVGDYDKAIAALPGTPFAARAQLGKAVCLIQAGRNADGTGLLKQLADDTAQLRTTRCEAAYHLATLAFAENRFDEVVKHTGLIMQLDQQSLESRIDSWARRAMSLRFRVPATTVAPAQPAGEASPKVSVKPSGS
jgi:hypothetical protein